jgi:hypothetical protein
LDVLRGVKGLSVACGPTKRTLPGLSRLFLGRSESRLRGRGLPPAAEGGLSIPRSDNRDRLGGGSAEVAVSEAVDPSWLSRTETKLVWDLLAVRLSRSLWNFRFVVFKATGAAMMSRAAPCSRRSYFGLRKLVESVGRSLL